MPARAPHFICPHCHTPIDPGRMETAVNGAAEYRICPECDEAVVVLRPMPPAALASPVDGDEREALPLEPAGVSQTEMHHP